MTLDTYSTLLVSASIALFVVLVAVGISYWLSVGIRARIQRVPYFWFIAALAAIACISIAGSLVYQLVYDTPVCELCWWQRIFLYPTSVITLVALWYKTRETHITVAILSAFGLWYAIYHYYYHFQGFVLGNKLSLPCSYGGLMPACTDSPILVYGFATIPFMGIMVFGSMLMFAGFAHLTLKRSVLVNG